MPIDLQPLFRHGKGAFAQLDKRGVLGQTACNVNVLYKKTVR